jgi:CII-binding regulator of phage lambda lysogenization HflD
MPAKRPNTRKKTSSQKKARPSLDLVLKRLDKFDQRFDSLDRRIDMVDRKVDAVDQKADQRFDALDRGIDAVDRKVDALRQETVAEFKAVRGEMAQGFANSEERTAAEFKAVRDEMAQGFDSLRQEFKAELQKEFENYGAKTYPIFTRLENKTNALEERFSSFNQQFTGMDVMVKNYEQFKNDSAIIDAEHQDLKRDVENLKKRDMEKAAAIEKIEKDLDKLKAA